MSAAGPARTTLPLAGLALGLWAALPPYVGPSMPLDPVVEVVDHVVPSVLILAVSAAALAERVRAATTVMFVGGLLVALAGFWMVATHVPLLVQAAQGLVSWTPAVWHFAPGLAVVVFGGLWALRHGQDPEPTR